MTCHCPSAPDAQDRARFRLLPCAHAEHRIASVLVVADPFAPCLHGRSEVGRYREAHGCRRVLQRDARRNLSLTAVGLTVAEAAYFIALRDACWLLCFAALNNPPAVKPTPAEFAEDIVTQALSSVGMPDYT